MTLAPAQLERVIEKLQNYAIAIDALASKAHSASAQHNYGLEKQGTAELINEMLNLWWSNRR